MSNQQDFTFRISLTVLNHLGRNLYRSFSTVLGEAISNAWDADANNVQIILEKDRNKLVVIDDGIGMSKEDFQNRFLMIGFSKRKEGDLSPAGRPFVGRKGIGKLALLSCSETITIISKQQGREWVGGVIDNRDLDEAITNDIEASGYSLGHWEEKEFAQYCSGLEHGTLIVLEGFNGGIKNSEGQLRKLLALYFRFSLINPEFKISLNGNKVSEVDLEDLAKDTQFLWKFGDFTDPFVKSFTALEESEVLISAIDIRGFIGSVRKPRNLVISHFEERVTVDLFVNGRVRERDILKHIPTARIAENYFYGQLHLDTLEGDIDRFTSSREGIVSDDPVFSEFLKELKIHLQIIIDQWDDWRRMHRQEGDSAREGITMRQRKSEELFTAVTVDFELPISSKKRVEVEGWLDSLHNDASFNATAYMECFISENLVRKFALERKIVISKEAKAEAKIWKEKEVDSKNKGNISITIRSDDSDLTYLSMDGLANLVDKGDPNKDAGLFRDAKEYKPIRDACAHTSLLTPVAKSKLTTVYANIRARVVRLLEDQEQQEDDD